MREFMVFRGSLNNNCERYQKKEKNKREKRKGENNTQRPKHSIFY
jgi:hypothetical protein